MDVTRYVKVSQLVEPHRDQGNTRVGGAGLLRPRSLRAIFEESQQAMARSVLNEKRCGLYVFAAHRRAGQVAGLWLECTEQPRAGMIGRHDMVDLPLPLDEELSLRHLLFVVRRVQCEVRTTVVNLATTGGLEVSPGEPLRLIETNGFLAVSAANFAFSCVPTGGGLPWKPYAKSAWDSLTHPAPSRVEAVERPCLGTPTLAVDLMGRDGPQRASFDTVSLSRGVLIGRDPRCDLRAQDNTLSRVHAVLVNIDGRPFIVDSGSTNGIQFEGEEVKIARLDSRKSFTLGMDVMLTCHPR